MKQRDNFRLRSAAGGGVGVGRLEVSGGFLLWTALLWYLGLEETLLWCLAASLVHELGHAAAAWQMGVTIRRLRVTVVGAEMVLRPSQLLSYPQELVIALAGPAANLLTGLAAARLSHRSGLFVGSSVMLGVFNLLPLSPLDGGQALRAAVALLVSPEAGGRLVAALTAIGTALLLAAGLWVLMRTGYNISLLSIGLWVLISAVGQQGGRKLIGSGQGRTTSAASR